MDLAKTLAKYADKPIFYVTLDPERALGLEDILPNYTIICPYKSQLTDQLKKRGIQTLILEEQLRQETVESIVQRGTYGILSAFGRQFGVIPRDSYILVLKNSQLIEDFCKKQGWRLLAPKAKIAEKFENKISQYKVLENVVPYPKTFLSTVEGLCRRGIERQFVLQFNRGHSGNSTFFVKSKKDVEKLYKLYPRREVKVSEYIKGKTYTLNCLALKDGGVITGSISEQITGLKSATNNPNTTCGNDFNSPKRLPQRAVAGIAEIARKVGKILHQNAYRGLFGIGVIIETSTRELYFIELNTHQPASVSFEAKLHQKIGKVPLLAYFILDSLGAGVKPVRRDVPPLILPIFAKQVVYRNKTKRILTREYSEKKYSAKGGSASGGKNKRLISRMKYIKPNEEIYRKQVIS